MINIKQNNHRAYLAIATKLSLSLNKIDNYGQNKTKPNKIQQTPESLIKEKLLINTRLSECCLNC